MPIMRRVLAIASLPQASTALRLRSSLFALAQASSSLLLCNCLGILLKIRLDERRKFPDV